MIYGVILVITISNCTKFLMFLETLMNGCDGRVAEIMRLVHA